MTPDSPLVLGCRTEGAHRDPGPVEVVWRAGIDLNPLDVTDPDDVRWLETLIWPGQDHRVERLHAAVAIARREPPRIVRGDLNDRLRELVAEAPAGVTLVVFHTAVLAYVGDPGRTRFTEQVRDPGARWITQEGPGVVPGVVAPPPPVANGATHVVALDRRPVANSAAHGGWLHWLS